MNPELVLTALDERGEPDKQEKSSGKALGDEAATATSKPASAGAIASLGSLEIKNSAKPD